MKKTNVTLRTITATEQKIINGIIKDFHNVNTKTNAIKHCIKSFPHQEKQRLKIEKLESIIIEHEANFKVLQTSIHTIQSFSKVDI